MFRTRLPVAISVLLHHAAPRLACIKPAASVHPEPGSNSSSYIVCQARLDYLLFDSNSSGFLNLPILLLSFIIVLKISLKNGCQFNMSRNVSFLFFRLSLKAGAKVINSFVSGKKKLFYFFEIK